MRAVEYAIRLPTPIAGVKEPGIEVHDKISGRLPICLLFVVNLFEFHAEIAADCG